MPSPFLHPKLIVVTLAAPAEDFAAAFLMDEVALLDTLVGIGDEPAASAPVGGDSVVGIVVGEDSELEGLLALAAPPERRRVTFPQNSAEGCIVMTARRVAQQAKRKVKVEKIKGERMRQQLTVAKMLASPSAFALCRGQKLSSAEKPLDPLTKGAVLCVLAFARSKRSDDAMTKKQDIAAKRVVSVVSRLQQQCAQNFLFAASTGSSFFSSALAVPAEVRLAAAGPVGPPIVVKMFSHQFDTTKQRLKQKLPESERLPGESNIQSYVTATVMMQEAQLHRCISWPGGHREVEDHPFLMPATTLVKSNANHYLASLLRRLPINFENAAELQRLASGADFMWFCWGTDRDITLASVLDWFIDLLVRSTPRTVLTHVEMCALHGVQLVKDRFPHSRACAIQSVSLCKQFRHTTFRQGARAAIIDHVDSSCRVRNCKRPDGIVSHAAVLFEALFGDRKTYRIVEHDAAPGSRRKRTTKRKESALLCRIDRMLESFDIVRRPDGTMRLVWCHYCFVEEDPCSLTAPVGGGRGRRCCGSDAEGRRKVAGIVCNYLFAATWAVAAVNRWAYIGHVWKKMLLLCLLDDSLMVMLDGVRRGAGLELNLEDALTRAVAANPEDLSSKNHLKVIRLCKTLGHPNSSVLMVVGVMLSLLMDRIHYSVLGRSQHSREKQKRASLIDLVNPTSSVIGWAEDQLVQLADTFRADCSSWLLLACLGVSFATQRVRLLARAALIRNHTGLVHHFTKKFSSAPYILLLTLPDVDVSSSVKRAISEEFVFRTPRACLPLGAQRLQDACSSVNDVMTVLCEPVRVWGAQTPVATDNVERAHAQVKQDLKSATRGRTSEQSQDRVFCKQVRATHIARKGTDPAVLCPSVAAPADDVDLQRKNKHAGSAQLRHRNNKLQAWKSLQAPNRAMTDAERADVIRLSDADWARILLNTEEHQSWNDHTLLHKGRPAPARRDIGSAVVAPQTQRTVFRGLWTNHTEDSSRIFSDAHMRSLGEAVDIEESLAAPAEFSLGSERDVDVDEVPPRCHPTGQGWGPLWGCAGKVKNICRLHGSLEAVAVRSLDASLAHLNSWIRSLGRKTVDEVNSFALFRTSARAEDGSSLDRICLLSDGIYQPVAQYYTRCHLPADASTCFTVPTLPFKLRIGASTGSSRLRGSWRSFWTLTSDEFALELIRTSEDWSIIPLDCECDLQSTSLRDCIVVCFLEEILHPRVAPKLKRSFMQMDEMLVLSLPDDCPAAELPAHSSWGNLGCSSWEEGAEEEIATDSDLEEALEESEQAWAEEEAMAVPGIPEEAAAASDAEEDVLDLFVDYTVEDYADAAQVNSGRVECDLPPWRDF